MLPPKLINLSLDVRNIRVRLFYGRPSVPLALPPLDVAAHLVYPPLLFEALVANLARGGHEGGLKDEFEPARLSGAVLLVALLTKVSPFPVSAVPAGLFKVAHFCWGLRREEKVLAMVL